MNVDGWSCAATQIQDLCWTGGGAPTGKGWGGGRACMRLSGVLCTSREGRPLGRALGEGSGRAMGGSEWADEAGEAGPGQAGQCSHVSDRRGRRYRTSFHPTLHLRR